MIDNFALIIGAMKCGTTSLFSYLAQHPQIAACQKKETFFFSANNCWNRGFEWYQSLWDWNPNIHKIALEASVDYTRIPTYPNAAERIASLGERANFKFIYILRNPLERIESHYTHGLAQNWESTQKPLAEEIHPELIEASQYSRQIQEYYQRFSAENILLVNFEDLKKEPLTLFKTIANFLQIDPDYEFQGLNKVYNANNQRITNEQLWRSLRKNKLLKSLRKHISEQQKQKIYNFFGKKIDNNVKLLPEQRKMVWHLLEDDLNQLQQKYQFDISRWEV